MANYDIPQYPTKRLRYFNNQFLRDQDFIDDNSSQIGRERAFLRSLCIAGVCEGMAVSCPVADRPPSVGAGIAIDQSGRMIVLDQPTDGRASPGGLADGEYFVHIGFLETEDDRATGRGTLDYTRWKQAPVIDMTAKTAALPDGVVVLGSCTVAGGAFVGPGTAIGRQYSGLRLPGPNQGVVATLRNSGAADDLAVLTGSLTVRRDTGSAIGPVLALTNGNAYPGGAGAGAALDFNPYDPGANAPSLRFQSLGDGNGSSHLAVLTKAPGSEANTLVERVRVTSTGHVGIGTQAPSDILHVRNADTVGLLESSTTQAALRLATSEGMANHVELANRPGGHAAISVGAAGDALLIRKDGGVIVSKAAGGVGDLTVENVLRFPNEYARDKIVLADSGGIQRFGIGLNTGNINLFYPATGNFSLRQSSATGTEVFSVDGSGTATFSGAIVPKVGNNTSSGIYFPTNPGGGTGDEAFLRYYATSGEATALVLGINNEPADALVLYQAGSERINISNGMISLTGKTQINGPVDGSLTIRRDVNAQLGPTLTLHNNAGGAGAGGAIDFNGYDVGANSPSLRLRSLDDGRFSSHLTFSTKASGANTNSLVERLRLTSDGLLKFPNATKDKIVLWDSATTDRYGIGLNDSNVNLFYPTTARFSLRQNSFNGTELLSVTGDGVLKFPNVVKDKIVLWDDGIGRFGIGVDYGNLNLFYPSNNRFSLRQNSFSGTEVFTVNGSGTATFSGAIVPKVGNDASSGIYFPANPGGGTGDEAFLRYYVTSGDDTKLVLGINNDRADALVLQQAGVESIFIANGIIQLNAPINAVLTIRRDVSGQLGPTLILQNSAGGAGAGGAIDFNGYDVGASSPSLRLQSLHDGNFSSHLTFSTKSSGANTNPLVERLRLTSDGLLKFPNESKDKIVLWDDGTARFGIGVNAGNLNLFYPSNNRFSLCQNSSTGTEVFSVNGSGTATFSGAIVPKVGNDASSGIYFPTNPGGGTGDEAFLRYYVTAGETTKLVLGVNNEPDDALVLYQAGAERITIANNLVSIANSVVVSGSLTLPKQVIQLGTTDGSTAAANEVVGGIGFMGTGASSGQLSYRTSQGFELVDCSTSGPRVGYSATEFPYANLTLNRLTLPQPSGGQRVSMYYEAGSAGHFVIYNASARGVYLVFGLGWVTESDAALKADVVAHEPVLDRVMQLRPVRYTWKADGSEGSGFIAQEVETLFPDLVHEGPLDEATGRRPKGMSYERFGVLAIAAIQELKTAYDARLDALERRLATLEGKS